MFGIPLLFLYLFGAWLIVVLLVALILRTGERAPTAATARGATGG